MSASSLSRNVKSGSSHLLVHVSVATDGNDQCQGGSHVKHHVQKVFFTACMLTGFTLSAHEALAETPPEKRFAVLVGSGTKEGGRSEIWGDLQHAYQTLLANGYQQDHIYVLSGAGCGQGGAAAGFVRYYDDDTLEAVDKPCDLDGDANDEIPGTPASKANIVNLLAGLNGVLDRDSFLYVLLTADGQGNLDTSGSLDYTLFRSYGCTPYANPGPTEEEAKETCLWNEAFTEAIDQIQAYAYMSLHLRFCFSGGWIEDVSGPRRVVLTATDSEHYAGYATEGSSHGNMILNALNGRTRFPLPDGLDISVDVDIRERQ